MTISYSGSFIKVLRRWKGSVWKAVWKELLVFILLFYVVYYIIILFTRNSPARYKTAQDVVKVFDKFTDKVPLHFLLGFYVGQVVTRWWAQVQAVPWPDEIMVWTNAFFPKNDYITKLKRRTVARYLILCETLVFRNVSTRIRKRFPTVQSLVKAELMTEEELDLYHKVVVENARWQLPLQWIINGIFIPASSTNEIPGSAVGTLVGKVNDFRNALRTLYMYDWVCIPLVYTQTCSVVVYGYFAFCLIGHQYLARETDLYFPFLTVLQFVFFVGWFKVAQDLMRPFGEDDDDIELNVVLDRHAAVAVNFAEQLNTLIPSIPGKVAVKEGEANDKTGAEAKPPDTTAEETPDGDTLMPFLILPYSRASLKYPRDHFPKLHARVEFKTDEEELMQHGSNPFTSGQGPHVKDGGSNVPYATRRKGAFNPENQNMF